MKQKILFSMMLFMSIMFSASMAAQSIDKLKTAEERATLLTNEMKKRLSLTDSQVKSVGDINLKYEKQTEEIALGSGDKKDKASKIKKLLGNKDNELKAILTDIQNKEYGNIKKEIKSQAKDFLKKKL